MARRLIELSRLRWVDRALLVPKLRVRMAVRGFKREYASLYAVHCSALELGEVEAITTTEILRLGRGMQHYVGVSRPIPRIRVFCFGTNARLEITPRAIREWAGKPFGRGVWLQEMRAAIALFDPNEPIRQVVIHELAHGLLDVLSNDFPYPITIAEGFARRAEYLVRDSKGLTEWERVSESESQQTARHMRNEHFMTVRDLLYFDPKEYWRRDMKAFSRMTNASFWLNIFLSRVSRQSPDVGRMLSELRLSNVRTPEGVYSWLQEASGMRADRLEDKFHRFCTKGKFSSA